MARKGSGIGMVMLVVVLAIVLLLVARNWRTMAPTVMEFSDSQMHELVDDHGQTETGEEIRSGQLPGLNDMRQETGAHAAQLQEALEATE